MNIHFNAKIIEGEGRGKKLGAPTLNLRLSEVPQDLDDGVYAVAANGRLAVMHYGNRETFGLPRSCEVHLIKSKDEKVESKGLLHVKVIEKIRDVRKFKNEDELKKQIRMDVEAAKHGTRNTEHRARGTRDRGTNTSSG